MCSIDASQHVGRCLHVLATVKVVKEKGNAGVGGALGRQWHQVVPVRRTAKALRLPGGH